MSAKHTPGPWHLSAQRDQTWVVYVQERDIAGREESDAENEIADAYSENDARLIAAAPELLEACKGILRSDVHNSKTESYPAFVALRDAIAKAEGTS